MTSRRCPSSASPPAAGAWRSPPPALLAAAPTERRLVVVILRGAMDGLGAVAALRRPGLRGSPRPARHHAARRPPDLDGFFALHPALPTLAAWYKAGETRGPPRHRHALPRALALRRPGPARERHPPPRRCGSGWLNRALSLMPASGDRLGLAMAPAAPLVIRGERAGPRAGPRACSPPPRTSCMATLASLYAADPLLGPAFAEGLASRGMAADGHGVPTVGARGLRRHGRRGRQAPRRPGRLPRRRPRARRLGHAPGPGHPRGPPRPPARHPRPGPRRAPHSPWATPGARPRSSPPPSSAAPSPPTAPAAPTTARPAPPSSPAARSPAAACWPAGRAWRRTASTRAGTWRRRPTCARR